MVHQCTKRVNHSSVKVEENNRKAVFRNPSNLDYDITTVDGCLIKDGMRSDFLVSEVGNCSVIVELKGVNVKHACEQLLATVNNLDVKKILEKKIGFVIVCRKYPRFDSFIMKAKIKFARDFKAGFHVICDKGEFDIEKVTSINGKVY